MSAIQREYEIGRLNAIAAADWSDQYLTTAADVRSRCFVWRLVRWLHLDHLLFICGIIQKQDFGEARESVVKCMKNVLSADNNSLDARTKDLFCRVILKVNGVIGRVNAKAGNDSIQPLAIEQFLPVSTHEEHVLVPVETLGNANDDLVDGDFSGKWWNPLPKAIMKRISGKSWNGYCPVPLKDLAYVRVSHWNLKKEVVEGELVYHKKLASEIVAIFKDIFESKFPIEKMRLIDDYDADDDASMAANNTSAFCSRAITGKPGAFSIHSYGSAIDINPKLNPYVKGETILPKGSDAYCDRTQDVPGLVREGDACFQAFIKRGYTWGGHWTSLKDYQHFEKDPKKTL